MRHLLHFRIGGLGVQLLRTLERILDVFPLTVFRHDHSEVGMRLGELLKTVGVSDGTGRKLARHFVVSRFDSV